MNIEKFKKRLLKEIIAELNHRQKVPVSFESVDIQLVSNDEYTGHVFCSEPRRTWKISLEVRLTDQTVSWKVENFDWYKFKLDSI